MEKRTWRALGHESLCRTRYYTGANRQHTTLHTSNQPSRLPYGRNHRPLFCSYVCVCVCLCVGHKEKDTTGKKRLPRQRVVINPAPNKQLRRCVGNQSMNHKVCSSSECVCVCAGMNRARTVQINDLHIERVNTANRETAGGLLRFGARLSFLPVFPQPEFMLSRLVVVVFDVRLAGCQLECGKWSVDREFSPPGAVSPFFTN